jgi:four helix bundle protein
MGKIEKFEDLIAWQKARVLTAEIYHLTQTGGFAKDFGLKNQIQRAAVSVMSNIAEGYERKRHKEFHQYLSIAKSSCAEVCSQLYVALDVGYINQAQFDYILPLANEVAAIIGGLKVSVANRIQNEKG